MLKKEPPATPIVSRGDKVKYLDRHGRVQNGEVRSIEARWHGWAKPSSYPLITYRVTHPSYRNKQTDIAQEDLLE